jgi:hypothetical protein
LDTDTDLETETETGHCPTHALFNLSIAQAMLNVGLGIAQRMLKVELGIAQSCALHEYPIKSRRAFFRLALWPE